MGHLPCKMAVLVWALMAYVTVSSAQVKLKSKAEGTNKLSTQLQGLILNNVRGLGHIENHALELDGSNNPKSLTNSHMQVFTDIQQTKGLCKTQSLSNAKAASVKQRLAKREAKKPKNTMRRRKFSKKKMEALAQKQKDTPTSKPESKSHISKSESSSEEDSEVPETKSSSSGSSSSYELASGSSSSESYSHIRSSELSSESSSSASSSAPSSASSSDSSSSSDSTTSESSSSSSSDSSSSSTEEVSLTSEEESKKPYSGPDSSSVDSSDSTDESSASRYIKRSSDISYTLSSDASVYSSSEESHEERTTNGSKKTNKTKIDININIKEGMKDKRVEINANTGANIGSKISRNTKVNSVKLAHDPKHFSALTHDAMRMVGPSGKNNLHPKTESVKPKMEMMRVKPAANYSRKKEDLKHDLERDYPDNETVEILNWEGTFAPIHGEPYVAPLDQQPDSFWDAIYRSTDPDLPTPPGVEVNLPQPTDQPHVKLGKASNNLQMKTKDKVKKEKKKPKLTKKEKKQKKRDKKEKGNSNNMARPQGNIKLTGKTSNNMQHKEGVHMGLTPTKHLIHAAGKSEENLKTPSEEERESGTTYRPEGNYEYPSFRHPDFNPDTAYDENGIPIQESPGWTAPPTLKGDYRFAKKHHLADPEHAARFQAPEYVPLAKPLVAHPHLMGLHQPDNLHKVLATQEHQLLAETLGSVHTNPVVSHNKDFLHHDVNTHLNAPEQNNVANHIVLKREASEEVSKESLGKVKKNIEEEHKRKLERDYKAYKLTDSEMLHKEDSAPLEALNPDLYMHRNMLKARRKKPKRRLEEIPDSAEVIAVLVSPQNGGKVMGQMNLGNIRRTSFTKAPIVYSKHNEARNPLLYKYRNMFKVSHIKDDGFKMSKDIINQAALNNAKGNNNVKPIALEDYVNQRHTLSGRGRENFNPIFINNNKMFSVKTNKFEPTSAEQYIVKREVKESQNPHLYSFQNIFSRNPKQVLPLKKSEQVDVSNKAIDPSIINNRIFGRGVPIIDSDSPEAVLDPKVKQYLGKNKEAMNPYLVNYPNMFAVKPISLSNIKGSRSDTSLNNAKQPKISKPNNALDPKVFEYMGKRKENLNPYLYKFSNMFTVNSDNSTIFTAGAKTSLHKVPLQKDPVNPFLSVYQKKAQVKEVLHEKVKGHKIRKREMNTN